MLENNFYLKAPSIAIRYRRLVGYGYEPEIAFAKKFLASHPGTFVDIGAHLGTWAIQLHRVALASTLVEPNPHLAALLVRSGLKNTVVHQIACSDQSNWVDLEVPILDGLPRPGSGTIVGFRLADNTPRERIRVRTKCLDELNLEKISLIKIDIEGAEIGCLLGAGRTISANLPAIVIELHPDRDADFREISEELSQFGYRSFTLAEDRLSLLEGRNTMSENQIFLPS